jgi:hypothetical protein
VKWSILRRRPSPALVISMVALFVSLSGVSYGVATGFIDSREIKNNEIRSLDLRNNEIRTRDLRNNQVRGIDIRNSTVQGRDIALNAVTGTDVKEDTLGKVPSATSADTATSATSATTAGGVSTLRIIPRTVVAADGPDSTLATHGSLTLSGRCFDLGDETRAQLRVDSTEDNSAAGGTSTAGAVGSQDPDLDSAGGSTLVAALDDAAAAPRSVGTSSVFASAPSGKGFTGDVALYADAEAHVCTFHGGLALQG